MKKHVLAMFMATALLCGLVTGCGRGTEPAEPAAPAVESEPEASGDVVAPTQDGADAVADEGTDEIPSEYAGEYVSIYTEDIDGELVSSEHSYVLNADGTGTVTHQDTVDITWDEDAIYVNGEAHKYRVEGNTLQVNEFESEWVSYTKK